MKLFWIFVGSRSYTVHADEATINAANYLVFMLEGNFTAMFKNWDCYCTEEQAK